MAAAVTKREVFVTALSTDDYLPGVLVLNRTICETCLHRLYVLAARNLAEQTYEALRRSGIPYETVDDIPFNSGLLSGMDPVFTHWAKTFIKIRLFGLTQYDKIVFIDSDIMVLEALDDLFMRPDISAVIAGKSFPGNSSWRDFNSGVLVAVPRHGTEDRLIEAIHQVAANTRSFGDQDVLNAWFTGWASDERLHLPEEYNVFFDHYQYYAKHGGVKAVHFIGKTKPWMMRRRDVPGQILRCFVKGNPGGVRVLLRYFRYLKEL